MNTMLIVLIIIGALTVPRFTACILLLWIGFMLSGCSTLPATVAECSVVHATPTEVAECELAVVQREDRYAKRKEYERLQDARSYNCTRMGGIYDRRMDVCRSWSML